MEMLEAAVASKERLGFLWQANATGLVLPDRFTRAPEFVAATKASAARGWPVVSRKTGGGITPQGPGVLNLALCFTVPPGASRAIRASYAEIVDPMRAGFADLAITAEATPVEGSFCDGDYNLAVEGRKLVGTAQRWRGTTCLIHALVMTDIDLPVAVDAVAAFSRDLRHDTVFDRDVHCRMADLIEAEDVTRATADALWRAAKAASYIPFSQ